MKQLLLAAPLGLALILAAAPASANSGTIFFAGEIRAGSCPIEVVDPISGAVGTTVPMGIANVADFAGVNAEANERRFGLRVPDSCVANAGDMTVNFVSQAGPTGAGAAFYGLRSGASSAGGLALTLKDARTGTAIAHGAESAPYVVAVGKGVDMQFLAAYRSTAAVTPGSVNADINFTVTLP